MRATKLTVTAAAAVCAVVPAVMGQATASAAPADNGKASTSVVKDRSNQGRELEIVGAKADNSELEIIRGGKRLRNMSVRSGSDRELEIIRGIRKSDNELEITRVHPR